MWRLTVVRKYTKEGTSFEYEDKMYFEGECLTDMEIVIRKISEYSVNGKYEYIITKEEGEE